MMADMPPIDAEDTLDDEMCAPVVNEATGEVRVLARSSAAKDVETLMLRHQLGVAQRIQPRPQLSWSERAVMAALLRMVNKHQRARLALLVTPRSVLRRHPRLVARKWTYAHRRPGRPPTPEALRQLVLRLARGNPGVGISTDPRRTARPGTQTGRLDRLGDLAEGRDRPRTPAHQPVLAPLPQSPGIPAPTGALRTRNGLTRQTQRNATRQAGESSSMGGMKARSHRSVWATWASAAPAAARGSRSAIAVASTR